MAQDTWWNVWFLAAKKRNDFIIHAQSEKTGLTACGINTENRWTDSGWLALGEFTPSCFRCKKKLKKMGLI